jgi:hypothetical protein
MTQVADGLCCLVRAATYMTPVVLGEPHWVSPTRLPRRKIPQSQGQDAAAAAGGLVCSRRISLSSSGSSPRVVLGSRTERMASMANRSLGRSRVSVPVVALGTWQRLEAAASRQHRAHRGYHRGGHPAHRYLIHVRRRGACADMSTNLVCRQSKAGTTIN